MSIHCPVETSDPTECILWKTHALTIEQVHGAFDLLTIVSEDSHSIRKLLCCKECGHLQFYEFNEEVDWQEGKDGQYWTWIPVDDEKSAENLSVISVMEILMYPSIRYDYPKGSDSARGPAWYGRRSS
jgi:hypothetical protein